MKSSLAHLVFGALWTAPFQGMAAPIDAHQETCVPVPSWDPEAAVRVCHTDAIIRYEIGEESYSYRRRDYERELAASIRSWVETATKERLTLCHAPVTVWVSVPETNPSAAQARFVVDGSRHDFVGYGSIHPEEWQFADDSVSILGNTPYPDSFGHRPKQILISKTVGATEETLERFLKPYITGPLTKVSQDVYRAPVRVFQEQQTATQILQHPRASEFVRYITLNSLFEWISWREPVLTFVSDCDVLP